MNCDIKNSEVLSIIDVENSSWYWTWQSAWQFLSENAAGDEHKKLKLVGKV